MQPNGRTTLSIIIPCYNEARTIERVVERVAASSVAPWEKEILVVDDGSDEETRNALRRLPQNVRVIYRAKNGGKGAAVKDGLAAASGEYCLIQDADLELAPEEYHLLIAPIVEGTAQATFGYRTLVPGTPRAPTLFLGGKALTFFYNLLFWTTFKDIPCCYKLFPRACIPALLATPSNDFVFDAIEMTRVIARSAHVGEVPVTYAPRQRTAGKKLFVRHGLYCAIAIVLLRLGLHRRPVDEELPRFLRYLVSGVTTVGVNISALYLLVEMAGVWYLTGSILAFVFSYSVNFSLHKFWAFRAAEWSALFSELPKHLTLALWNVALNTLLLYLLVQHAGISYLYAQLIASALIAAESFIILSHLIFNGRPQRATA